MLADKNFRRVEDERFLVGRGQYVDNIKPENPLHLGIVRSTYPHAEIIRIDFSKASENPSFVLGLTGNDIKDISQPITTNPAQKHANRFQLAVGKTRYVGEPVAAFVSKNKYAVEDIVELVEIEYRVLPSVLTIEESKIAETLLYDDWNDNVAFRRSVKKGNAEEAISSSKHSIRARIGIRRQEGVPIEPRSVVVYYDESHDSYTVHGTVQSPHGLRNYLSTELRLPAEKFHIIVKDVGGGFGTKGAQSYPEPLLACIFAKRTGSAIKWTSTRTEDFLEAAAGRDQYCDIELACDENLKITALRARSESDVGVSGTLSISVGLSIMLLPGAYKIPNLDLEGVAYVTNKAPLGPVRGAGRPEAAFFIERAIDILAGELSLDPLSLRMKNLIRSEEMPYDNGTGFVYDSGNFQLLLEKLEDDYSQLKKWRQEVNSKGDRFLAGVGICIEVEDTGSQFKETAREILNEQGKLKVLTGSSPHGQGLETTLALLASKELGVPFEDVSVSWGDTASLPWSIGTFGSRSVAVGGSAVVDATRKVRADALVRASKISGIKEEELSIEQGYIIKRGESEKRKIMKLSSLTESTGPIESYSEFALKGMPFASGAHLCGVLIDKETGIVEVKKYFAVDDCGVPINPVIVEGQLHGGIVHGIGGSLLEIMLYDSNGQPLTTNFLDYTIPTSNEVPREFEILRIETRSPLTLNGSKGVGESGTVGAYPAIFNALNDAISPLRNGLNIAPALPEEILKVIQRNK